MCRQRAGCNPGRAKADGQRAWWKLPRGSWRVLRVLRVWSVWSLANGRLEWPNKRGLCAGKGQAATLEQQRLTARGLGGSCREGVGGFWSVWSLANGRLECPNKRGLCAGKGQAATLGRVLRVLRVWSVWSLANGRLECPNKRGLCAGKGQAATLEQQRLTARGLGGSCREGVGGF